MEPTAVRIRAQVWVDVGQSGERGLGEGRGGGRGAGTGTTRVVSPDWSFPEECEENRLGKKTTRRDKRRYGIKMRELTATRSEA